VPGPGAGREEKDVTYIEGFVIAVPTANKQKFIDHARLADAVFVDHGALRILECWQSDVPRGQVTDFFGAVDAREDESVVFSWMEWPDKATRQALTERMPELMRTDSRVDPEKNPMPFDGARMIYGGFETIVEHGAPTPGAYVQGFLLAVPDANQEAYRKLAEESWQTFQRFGALRVVEAWQDDVPEGKQTDFSRSVKARPDEKVVFSFIEWPSRAVWEAAARRMEAEMQPPPADQMPFDGKRMIYGCFEPVVELTRKGAPAGGER
jgi:uncharacterized protein YbaA (DUF1428 family)